SAGAFDINLRPTRGAGIECRSGGANGVYQMIVSFAEAVTCNSAQVTNGTGNVSNFTVSSDGTRVTIDLIGVTNAQTIIVTLNVTAGLNTSDVAVPMSVLVGDTTADGSVNSADISQTKSQSGHGVSSSNFREDVTVDGSINSSDISLVKSKSGTDLP